MLLIVPQHNTAHLATVTNGNLVFLRELTVDYQVPFHSWERGLLFIDRSHHLLRHAGADGSDGEQTWPLPAALEPYGHKLSLAVVGNRAYVSGVEESTRGPVLFSRSLLEKRAEWSSCYPAELMQRKEIDALVVCGRRLIAVDNVMVPKYLFFIDNADERFEPATVLHLPEHGTYEGILGAVMCANRLATLSMTMNMGGSGTHISFLAADTFEESGHLFAYSAPGAIPDSEENCSTSVGNALRSILIGSRGLATGAGRLIVACGSAGVVILHPERITSRVNAATPDDEVAFRSIACHLSLSQLPLHCVKGGTYSRKPEMVTDVLSAGKSGCVVIVEFSDHSNESVLLSKELLLALMP